MNRFQKYCMRQAKSIKKANVPDGSIFDVSNVSTYHLYKAHLSLYNQTKLEILLATEKSKS